MPACKAVIEKRLYKGPRQGEIGVALRMRIVVRIFLALGLLAAAMNVPAQQPGQKLWSFSAGQNIQSSPVIGTNGTVYFGADNGKLYALDPKGIEVWEFAAGANVISAPAIGADGTLYFGSLDRNLYALN